MPYPSVDRAVDNLETGSDNATQCEKYPHKPSKTEKRPEKPLAAGQPETLQNQAVCELTRHEFDKLCFRLVR